MLVSLGPPSGGNPIVFQGIFPSEGMEPEDREIARQTVETVGAMGGWGQSNSFSETINVAVGAVVDPRQVLGNLTLQMDHVMPIDILGAERQKDAGATQAINDMLCSSYAGYMQLFERWPLEEDAAFTTLRAKGGFLVSASLESGAVANVTITLEEGETAVLFSPWSPAAFDVADSTGKLAPLSKGSVAVTHSLPTSKGATYSPTRCGNQTPRPPRLLPLDQQFSRPPTAAAAVASQQTSPT